MLGHTDTFTLAVAVYKVKLDQNKNTVEYGAAY